MTEMLDAWREAIPDLMPDFIFAFPGYTARNTEIGGILGLNQLKRLDENVERRNQNLVGFLDGIHEERYRTDFKLEGASNYAFNLILKRPDDDLAGRLMHAMRESGVEFRRAARVAATRFAGPTWGG